MTLPRYIIGQDPEHKRYFLFRTESPRFVAERVEPDEAGYGLTLGDGYGLNIRQWLDSPQPASSLIRFLAEISEDASRHGERGGIAAQRRAEDEPAPARLDAL